MQEDDRIENEIKHGIFVERQGEQIWNWSSPAGKKRWQRRVNLFCSFLGNNDKNVLEIGCGTGLFTAELVKTRNKITAIDISPNLISIAQQRIGNKALFFLLNAYDTNFPNNFFDFVIGSSVLHHLDVDFAIKEFYRILKPNGGFMFTEPNMLNPQIFLQKNIPFIKKMAGDSPDETAFIRWFLSRKLLHAGFNDVAVTPFDFIHPSVPEFLLGYLENSLYFLERIPLMKEFAGSLIITANKPTRDFHE